jgi:hypothetical protein
MGACADEGLVSGPPGLASTQGVEFGITRIGWANIPGVAEEPGAEQQDHTSETVKQFHRAIGSQQRAPTPMASALALSSRSLKENWTKCHTQRTQQVAQCES